MSYRPLVTEILQEYLPAGETPESFLDHAATNETDLLLYALIRELQTQRALQVGSTEPADIVLEEARDDSDAGTREAVYNSFEGLLAQSDAESQELDLIADTVVVRDVSDELEVAFQDPTDNQDSWITVESGDAPFVMSGVYGIATDTIWYRHGPNATGSHTINVLAVKRRGR